jgi:nitrite reductase/ring-hydroxylating ferredoxin subunit
VEKKMTRSEFLGDGGRICLALAAGGVLTTGCARHQGIDADAARPAGAPANYVAKVADVNPVFYFTKGKLKGVLVKTDKGIVGYEDVCPHMGGPTKLVSNELRCQWHGSRFDVATGHVLRGPAKSGLKALKLEVKDGLVLLLEA